MASQIAIAPGWNHPGALELFDPSPDTDGLEYPREIDAADGSGYFDGKPFMALRFPDVMTPADWVATLTKSGLSDPSVRRVKVTVRLPDENKVDYSIYNGWAQRSARTPHEYCWYRTPVIVVSRLVAIN